MYCSNATSPQKSSSENRMYDFLGVQGALALDSEEEQQQIIFVFFFFVFCFFKRKKKSSPSNSPQPRVCVESR